jgi:hypothetical protein
LTDGGGGTLAGRAAGFHIGTGTPPEYQTTYGYDAYGRIERITGPGLDSTHGVRYTRVANSELIADVEFKDGSDATLAKIHRQFESDRDMLDYVENTVTGSPDVTVSKYDYTTDDLGRRTNVLHSGTAFNETHNLVFDYNNRNELTRADRWQGTGQTTYTAAPFAFEYAYDPIGNRDTFTADKCWCENPFSHLRIGESFRGSAFVGWESHKVWCQDGNLDTAYDEATTDPAESFDYDADGNMIADDTYTFVWDGENRLIEVAPASSPQSGDKRLEFKYDYMSRRVEKIYSVHDGNDWVEQTHERFVYDQWNVARHGDDLGSELE